MSSLEHVIVAGAGPAGLVAALVLQQEGLRVTVLEQQSEEEAFSDVGGAYDFNATVVEMLRRLGIRNVYRAFQRSADRIEDLQFLRLDGSPVRDIHIPQEKLEVYSMLRSKLQRFLHDLVDSS
ncbi:MAG: FAD-dependent monooxygenase, partial [Myxococcales bacterium]|nr:FAD-dependent monooxygenase [Myxococcales bacterium]